MFRPAISQLCRHISRTLAKREAIKGSPANEGRKLRAERLEDRRVLAIFLPSDVASLVAAIETAGTNDEPDIINLGGRTFSLTEINNTTDGPNGLPTVQADNGHKLTIENGHILRGRPRGEPQFLTVERGTPRFRLLHIGPSAEVTLDRLTLSAGFSFSGNGGGHGGAIYSEAASLTIQNSRLTGNGASLSGGGLHADVTSGSQLNVFNTLINHNQTFVDLNQIGGGGVYVRNFGDATITYSSIVANSTLAAGGGLHVYTAGQTVVQGSTIYDNRAGLDGGGLALGGEGNAQTLVVDSTISGNAAERHGGGIVATRDADIHQSTITQNQSDHIGGWGDNRGGDGIGDGGGVYAQDATLRVESTIVAGNRNVWTPSTSDLGGRQQSLLVTNYSLIGVAPGELNGHDNLIGVDPLLGPLANNGGPTQTHAPSLFSPAIDAGSFGATSQWDQRGPGFARRVGSRVDIGAHEHDRLAYPESLVVSTMEDGIDGDVSPGNLSLREAVALSSKPLFGRRGAISFDPVLFSTQQVIRLTDGQIEVTGYLTINGPGKELVTIDAQFDSRIFNIAGSGRSRVYLAGMTLSGGTVIGSHDSLEETTYDGGAIRSTSHGSLRLVDVAIESSSVRGDFLQGGGIYAVGSVHLENSTLSGNLADGQNTRGGAVYSDTSVSMVNSSVAGSYAATGGGIAAYGPVSLSDSRVIGNEATRDGGGIYGRSGVVLTRTTVLANRTVGRQSRGGGVFSHGNVELYETTLQANRARGYLASGGGLYAGGDAIVSRSTVSENVVWDLGNRGGGIFARQGVTLIDSTVAFNSNRGGEGVGGGVAAEGVETAMSTLGIERSGKVSSASRPGHPE